ncbi:MAG: protein TolR [Desulfobacula sp.]|jgi:biopolymer transport protein TolR|uniref:protein TolR n=1 Tax=Desulfobacula sp. TaxID=2593537 RepID=UPI001D4E822C|nr:protein TolR [Desulfobacula sp.]MBT3485171.1 protein TolR [Desulfobacula sp.]MBT3804084.1 protein TolR [Desulfobacula sp.]MBT4025375.1 protein TolR [Desulfobacula sp.]MBT4199473.1 protein TolR [Desulfobacula sp.]
MQLGSGNDQLMSEINVTPFVDVMLVLLIIFMVTAPMMVQGVDVDLPKATSKALKGSEDRLIISIDDAHKVFINEQVVSVEFLTQKLGAILENFDKKNVYLRADKKVPYGIVVNVISKIKKAGVDSLGMITLPENKDES